MSGSDGHVFDDEIASAPPTNDAPASSAMFAVAGVSFTHTGTFATSFTATVTTEQSTLSLPTFEPMSTRSMCGQEKFSSRPSAPASCTPLVSSCQLCSSLTEAVRARVLHALGQQLPVVQLLVVARAGHDRGDEDLVGERLLDRLDARQPPVDGLVGDQLPVPPRDARRVGFLVHRQAIAAVLRAEELRLRTLHVHDRMEADGLRDHAAPAGLEGSHDVGDRKSTR